MNWSRKLACCATGAAIVLTFGALGAGAADYKATGTVTYVTVGGDAVKLPGGLIKRHIQTKGVIQAGDPTNPFHLSAQDCAGSIVFLAGGAPVDGAGYCEATDKDGDVWWLSWSGYNGTTNGWTITGGTGKYKGMTGGGTVTVMMQSADGRSVNSWSGAWTMK